MPLFKTIIPNNYTTVFVWKIDESFDELLKGIQLTSNSLKS